MSFFLQFNALSAGHSTTASDLVRIMNNILADRALEFSGF
jgi:hypothetical protein